MFRWGSFWETRVLILSLKCQNPICKKSVLDHSLSFIHKDGLINITVCTLILVCDCIG